jgi:hypothetical protein
MWKRRIVMARAPSIASPRKDMGEDDTHTRILRTMPCSGIVSSRHVFGYGVSSRLLHLQAIASTPRSLCLQQYVPRATSSSSDASSWRRAKDTRRSEVLERLQSVLQRAVHRQSVSPCARHDQNQLAYLCGAEKAISAIPRSHVAEW